MLPRLHHFAKTIARRLNLHYYAPMISLIVNADDLGCNAERDCGILRAFTDGIVTSASLLANGPTFVTAAAQSKAVEMPVGVHLNLTEGATLTGLIKGLTDERGRLPGKQELRWCLAQGDCDPAAIRRELAAQVERLFDAGLHPDHLDSHQHCQLYPCITAIATDLAREYGISAMRNSLPGEPAEEDTVGELVEELTLYRQLAQAAQATLSGAGLRVPQGLWGMPLLNRLDTNRLCHLLERLPEGFWELMTHPGYPYEQGGPFDGPQRQEELQALLSAEVREIIFRRRIGLCTFGELPCVS
jgi:predicted glycoside hydrolase/deacetylase ChbG (UPF0249 family)